MGLPIFMIRKTSVYIFVKIFRFFKKIIVELC